MYRDIWRRIVYVRYQGVRRDEGGLIVAGSASIYRTVYDPGTGNKGHSRQEVVEPLGRVVWMESERGCRDAIFLSLSRGLVGYRVDDDEFYEVSPDDPRLEGTGLGNVDRQHVELGPAWVLLTLLARTPLPRVMTRALGPLHQRALAHLSHRVCVGDARSPKCGSWLDGSVLSWLLPDLARSTLDCDTAYFRAMGDDAVKVAVFGCLVQEMRALCPDFGTCCYVDSTPLPGEAEGNPFNALCSHGTDGCVTRPRLALVLDAGTGIPVWFEVMAPDVLDRSAIAPVKADVEETLDVTVDSMDLDAGYACPALFEAYNRDNATYVDARTGEVRHRSVVVRMPARAGYPFDELYVESKPRLHDVDRAFDLDGHTYYGERHERDVRGYREFVHVYVDHDRALALGRRWREDNPEAWESLSRDDREWHMVKDGLFMLVGNADVTPREALAEYKARAGIESFFKDPESYLRLLPIAKWSKEAVLGKILSDALVTVAYRAVRLEMAATARPVSDVMAELRSLGCTHTTGGMVTVSTPKRQVRESLADLGIVVPGHMSVEDLSALALRGVAPDPTPVTARRARAGRKPKVRHSPEERARAKEERKAAKAATAKEAAKAKAEAKATTKAMAKATT